jgi:hypothetical protein
MERSDFIALFKRFESERNLTSVENESLAPILMAIADDEDPFIGTATTLLGLKEHEYDLQGPGNGVGPRWIRARAEQAGINWERDRTMPKDPVRLGRRLDRLTSILDNVGYDLFRGEARDMLARCPEYEEIINQHKKEKRLIVLRRRSAGADSIMAGRDSKTGGQQQL